MKLKLEYALGFMIIAVCFVFFWFGKDGVIVAILIAVVSHFFGKVGEIFNKKDKE